MSRVFFLFLFITAALLIFGLIEIILLRQLNRKWWDKKIIRRSAIYLPVIGIIFFNIFGVGEYYKIIWMSTLGGFVSVTAFVLEISLMFSLPISGFIHLSEKLYDFIIGKREKVKEVSVNRSRRLFLSSAATIVPVSALGIGLAGIGRAYGGASLIQKEFSYDNLPDDLQGLKILHLTDLHLRHYVTLDDLEALLIDIEPERPDIVLVTGDIADDLTQLPDALKMINDLNAPLGCYASLGNHEYFRGIKSVREIFERSPIRLMIDEGINIKHGNSQLFIGGVDDPVRISQISPGFFTAAMDKTDTFRHSDSFSLLMSHRPDIFPLASERGIELTLAGHTHGGQVGFFGRSLLESSFPNKYLWGHYQEGNSQLYTSSGVGHWFPFRLGCPPEAPMITLKKA